MYSSRQFLWHLAQNFDMCTINDKQDVKLIDQLLPCELENIWSHISNGILNSSTKIDNVMNRSTVHSVFHKNPQKQSSGVMSGYCGGHKIGKYFVQEFSHYHRPMRWSTMLLEDDCWLNVFHLRSHKVLQHDTIRGGSDCLLSEK